MSVNQWRVRTTCCACPALQPVTGRLVCTGVGGGADGGEVEVVGLGLGEVADGLGLGDVVVGGGDVGGVAGHDTQNTLCFAEPFSPANVQKSL